MQPPAAVNRAPFGDERNFPSPRQAVPVRESIRVALIGASVRAAAESAKHGGLAVTGIDRFADQDTLAACDRHVVLEAESGDQASGDVALGIPLRDAIARIGEEIPLIPVGGLNGFGRWLDPVPLLGPWPLQRQAAAKVRDPSFLRELTPGTAFSVPASFRFGGPPDGIKCDQADGRWLCKDLDSSGGLGTRWAHAPTTEAKPDDMLQRWVAGRAMGASFLSNGSQVLLLGICRQRFTRKGPFPFVYCGSVGPVSVGKTVQQALLEMGERISAKAGLRGLFNLDFIADPTGPLWLLEINPRWSGSSELIERHLQRRLPAVSLLSLMIDGLNGSSFGENLPAIMQVSAEDPVYVKRIVFARCDFRFDQKWIEAKLRTNETLHDIPPTGRWIVRGEPVCTLIMRLDRNEKDPMRRHRVLVNQLSGGTTSGH